MKILKPGVIPCTPTYRGECRNCGCEVECDSADLHDASVMYDQPTTHALAECPTCERFMAVRLVSERAPR